LRKVFFSITAQLVAYAQKRTINEVRKKKIRQIDQKNLYHFSGKTTHCAQVKDKNYFKVIKNF